MGGKKGRKRRERNQDWTCAPKKRAVKEEKVLHLGSPLMDRDQPGEGALEPLGGEHSNWFVVGKVENDLHRWSGLPP